MAPSIERIKTVLNEENVFAQERGALSTRREIFISTVSRIFAAEIEKSKGLPNYDRSIVAVNSIFERYGEYGFELLRNQYIKFVKYVEKKPLFGKEKKDFFFGIAYKYPDFKRIMPMSCSLFSGKECMEVNNNCWNIIEDPNKWNPNDGEFQVFETEDGIDDEIIVTEEIPKDTELWKALKDVNDKTGLFN